MTMSTHDAESHYDRVTDAWSLLLGRDLHYGDFARGATDLPTATTALTERLAEIVALARGDRVLDVGCGTGGPACHLAAAHGVSVTGITTSAVGVDASNRRAADAGLSRRARFEQRDGMDNGLPASTFDVVWVLESSHLMRRRDRLLAECARVLVPGGRLALCDIVLMRPMPFAEVRRLLEPLTLLRNVFGDARMEELSTYATLAADVGLEVTHRVDLTEATRPTFQAWRDNAATHRQTVVEQLGEEGWRQFVEACAVLEGFWDDGTLGYGLLAARRP